MNYRETHAHVSGRIIPQGLLKQRINSDALLFFSPAKQKPNKSSFHTTGRLRLQKQTDGEGGGERTSFSRQRFTLFFFLRKKKLHQNSHDRAELLSQNETSVEEAGSVCLLLRSA